MGRDRERAIVSGGNTLFEAAYDDAGLRIAKNDRTYTWGPGGLLEDTGTLYTPGLGYRGAAGDRFYHTDRLGSVRGVSDTQGAYAPGINYPDFGATSHTAGIFGFAAAWGYQNADGHLGLLYLQQRSYDTAWASPTPCVTTPTGRRALGAGSPATSSSPHWHRPCMLLPRE